MQLLFHGRNKIYVSVEIRSVTIVTAGRKKSDAGFIATCHRIKKMFWDEVDQR
jgi:hypothetical protein